MFGTHGPCRGTRTCWNGENCISFKNRYTTFRGESVAV
jgi:hypothetical protein